MDLKAPGTQECIAVDGESIVSLIVKTQRDSGEIPWSEGGKTDPWDLVEAAMGLTIGGCLKEAERAYDWLAGKQLKDGSWYASYKDGFPDDRTRDANVSSYIAVGVFHYYLTTGDERFLKHMWKTVQAAVRFAIELQAPSGEIYWAVSPEGVVDRMALLTGSSSVYMSLKCGLAIAERLGRRVPKWKEAMARLGNAIRYRRYLFNMTKARYSMDWFYPILCGAITEDEAHRRIDAYWNKFVVNGLGVRCVSDRPWITIAETAELCLALSAMGNRKLSEILFTWIQDRTYEDGTYWCGFTFPDMVIWPEEKITWTNAAVLLAADALYDLTPAGRLFSHRFWSDPRFSPFVGEPCDNDHARADACKDEECVTPAHGIR